MIKPLLTSVLLMTCLSACAGGKTLHRLENGEGADEFSVLPSHELEMPASFNALPVPTPGTANRVDRNPKAEAVAALGGRPAAMSAGGIPRADAALVAAAGRNGTDPAIRQTLANEDARFRKGRGGWAGLFNRQDPYFAAYRSQKLDAGAELQRLRQSGVETPSAPPQ